MKFLHTMLRVQDLDRALHFFCDVLGLQLTRKKDYDGFTLAFVSTGEPGDPEVELTYNWDQKEPYTEGRFFGHLAFQVENIYETCEKLQAAGVRILRPPRDGRMAFIKSPDQHSIELLQKGSALPLEEPWKSMPNQGTW